MQSVIRVLLADDSDAIRERLWKLIEAEPDLEVVGGAVNGRVTVEYGCSLRPDVIVMDLSMPVLSGLAATAELHACCPEIRVVALTTYQDQAHVTAIQKAGGCGYVLKYSPVEVLLEAIRVVAAGGVFLDPALPEAPPRAAPEMPAAQDVSPDVLSVEEREVLQLSARGQSSREIAAELGAQAAAVAGIRVRAMAKLNLQGRIALVQYAERHGWR